jgi:thiol-disulfide isomerase/thioredoxin
MKLIACMPHTGIHKTFRAALVVIATLMPFYAMAQWRPLSESGLKQTPKLELGNLAGNTISLDQFKGQVVLVNFWATWCEPCRDEFGELIHLQEKYSSKGLKVLAVNLAESKPKVHSFLKNNLIEPHSIEILLDQNSIFYKSWKARWIPVTYLVNKSGVAEAFWVGDIRADDSKFLKKLELSLR